MIINLFHSKSHWFQNPFFSQLPETRL